MKIIIKLLLVFVVLLTTKTIAQEEVVKEEFKPVYITVTTGHWNSHLETDFSDWKETQKEYFEKVTMKNDLIIGSGYYNHYFTEDNTEIVFVSIYKTWADIEEAINVSAKLEEAAWPDEEERKAFLKKRNNYYSPNHSDEIYGGIV